MRKIIFLLILFFISGLCAAQDQVQVTLSQPPPNQLRVTDLWRAILINTSKITLHVTLSGTLQVKGEGIVADGASRLLSLPPGTKMITYDDVKTGNMNFKQGTWSEAFNRTGIAPAGEYTICITVKAEDGREIGSSCIDQIIETITPVEVAPHLMTKLLPLVPNKLMLNDLFKCIITNLNPVAYRAPVISVELRENSTGLQIESKLNSVTIAGTKSFSFNDFNTPDLTYRNTKLQEAFSKNLIAPDGNYTICVYIKNEKGEVLASDCIDQTIITIKPEMVSLQLMTPADGSTLLPNQPVLFSWMLQSVKAGREVTYKIKVVEIYNKQSPIEAIKQNPAIFEKSNIKATMLQYPISAKKLETGKKYAWNVRVMNIGDQSVDDDRSSSEAFMLDVGGSNGVTKSLTIPTTQDSTISIAGSDSVAVGDTIRAGRNGEFKVVVTDATIESDGSLTGKGRVRINWLGTNVAVEFKKILVDTTKRLTSGGIVTTESGSSGTSYTTYPLAWAQSLLNGPGIANVVDNTVNWSNGKIDNIVNWINGLNYGQPQINYNGNIPPPVLPDYSLKMPFGLQFSNGNQKLVITEMVFKKDTSKVNFLAQVKFTKSGTPYTLGFAGKYFPFHPSGINFGSGRVELVQDIKIPNTSSNPKMIFKFIKGTSNSGCYVEWDSTGIKDISLALDVNFTRDWLLPVPTSTDTVKAALVGNGTSMHDILLTGTLDTCEIVGTNGIKIQSSPISLDLSDSRNPLNMNFPTNYPNDSTITWKGFYVKSFDVSLPETWKTGTNMNPVIVSANNFIIDDFGLTTKIKAVNVFNLQSGRIADLSASLDTVEISIISSSLVSGKAKGILVLPISEVTTQNSLKYTATFNQVSGGNNFQIAVLPIGPIDADVLKGKMTLLPTSSISANLSPNSNTLAINLNGTFEWDNPNFPIKGIKMEMGFENVGLNYFYSSTTNTLSFNPGSWSFASPPKWLANFPVSIKKVYYKSLTKASLPTPKMELLRGALMIDIVANLTEDIGGATTLGASFAIELNKSNRKFTPKFIEVFLDSISVHADMPAVKIDGNISIRNEDPIFGNGFLGELKVNFTSVGLKARALVEFGNTTYQYGSLYRYWRVEADLLLPPPGVPFLPGIAFRGFGGGAYYNMNATQVTSTKTLSGKKFTFTPLKSTMGLRVAATIATTPKEETFNADVGLLAQFSKSQGLTNIDFNGDFWIAAGFDKRPKAKINGSVNVGYNFPDKHFNLSASVNVNAPPITTPNPANLVLDIRGKTNKWFFKFGEPTTNENTLVNVDVSVLGVTAHLYEYLMFGNDITPPSGFTQTFINGYTAQFPGTSLNVETEGVTNSNTKTGKGLALGIGFEFNKNLSISLLGGAASASLALSAGAELNLAFAEYNGQNCENSSERIGINGWQASGSVGFYASVLASVQKGSSTWNLADIKAGGWLQGKFPNPVYVAGEIIGLVKVGGPFRHRYHPLGHWNKLNWSACTHYYYDYLINTSFNKSFEYGTNCTGITSAGSGAPVTQGDAAEDQKQLLIKYVHPTGQQYNFPLDSPISVLYGLIPNNVFDVSEQQSDGSIKNRTFKMVITTNMKIHNDDGSNSNVALKKNENNLGEFLYTVLNPISINTATPKTLGSTQTLNKPNTLNTFLNSGKMTAKTSASIGQPIFTSYPLPPASNTYNNLPPEPPEVKNTLTINKDYTFTVTATLKEFISNTWVDAKNKNNSPVTQTVIKKFRTGPMVLVASSGNTKSILINKVK
ncbi:MAG: hypothetical protein M0P71_06465 [Melioribacteraceae bacterium]|nr:hypothetical protein [Melioribacteraceae bacterium]